MRRPVLALVLSLAVLPAAALVQAQTDRLTPRAPPTAVLPKATPLHSEPKGKAPAGLATLLPLPSVPAPLSPITVPGDPPPVALPAAPMETVAAPPPPVPVPPAAQATGPLPPAKPKPAEVAKAAPDKPAAEKKSGPRTVYAREGIYIRVKPGRNSRVLDTLEPGETAQLVPGSEVDGWVRITREGKVGGWVSARFLGERAPDGASGDGCSMPADFPGSDALSIAAGGAARALTDANVRKSPACNAPVVDVLEEGETVTVTGAAGTWYRVARKGRALGYVSAPLLGVAR